MSCCQVARTISFQNVKKCDADNRRNSQANILLSGFAKDDLTLPMVLPFTLRGSTSRGEFPLQELSSSRVHGGIPNSHRDRLQRRIFASGVLRRQCRVLMLHILGRFFVVSQNSLRRRFISRHRAQTDRAICRTSFLTEHPHCWRQTSPRGSCVPAKMPAESTTILPS